MSDFAHDDTDELLDKTEREILAIYRAVQKDVAAQLAAAYEKVKDNPDPVIYWAEWNKYNRLKSLELQITEAIQEANVQAMRLSQAAWNSTYTMNYNYAAFVVEKSAGIVGALPLLDKRVVSTIVKKEFTPFSLMAIDNLQDKSQIMRDLTTQLTNGIMSGESMRKLSKRIEGVTGKNYSDSIRIARTETTRIENAARGDAYKEAEKIGVKMLKEWVATHDSRTRKAHRKADGQRVKVDDDFTVGGDKGAYPGQMGSAANDIACRCTTRPILEEYEEFAVSRATYAEWEAETKKAHAKE